MYNKCTAKSLDSGAGVRSRHSNRQNGDEHKEQTPKWCKRKSEQGKKEMRKQTNYWSSFSVTLRPLPRLLLIFSVVSFTQVKSSAVLLSCTWESDAMNPSHYSSEADYQGKPRQRHLPITHLYGQSAGEVLFTCLLHRSAWGTARMLRQRWNLTPGWHSQNWSFLSQLPLSMWISPIHDCVIMSNRTPI